MKNILESLDHGDLEGQLESRVSIDEYAAKIGPDRDIVTLSFIVKSKLSGEDLISWFEKGYDFVLDASMGDGELSPGKYIVFVEMNRRSKVPARVIELLSDLKTLTNIPLEDWIIQIDEKKYRASEEIIKLKVILNPNEYKAEKEESEDENEKPFSDLELNEMRIAAGLEPKKRFTNKKDSILQDFITSAGL